ncbi:hypothetical protein EV639_10979 [Rathayibacter tanaceti]|uniref:Uncharacterized protein n=2 Tax=Rathayibacter tanaceti TaxID=1671680 RepID=A0ACD2XHQ2_9MICO|nr:hypothetical protein ACH61_01630 [Rathayibacter tanaceti]TCO35075.1 hypothetical protein EV639_10979 [Rathayibacter tanaceti]
MSDPLFHPMPLRGAPAHEWLRERGGHTDADPAFALVGQEAQVEGVQLRRIWHTAGSVHFESDVWSDPDVVSLLLPLQGAFTIARRDARAIVGRGCFAALPAGAAATISTSSPTARLTLLTRPSGGIPPLVGLVVSTSPAVPVLIAAANAVLDARLSAGDPAIDGLRTALQGLAAAVLSG